MSNEPERQHPKEDEMSKDREELIEVVARAVCSQYGDDPDRVGFDRHGRREEFPEWVRWKSEAQAALSAIEGAGFVVLPREPEYAQLRAMSESVAVDDEGPFPSLHDLLDFSGENKVYTVLRAAYRAMINAYSPKPSGVEGPPPTQSEEP